MTPVDISLTAERQLQLVWSDGHVSRFALAELRDACPCAGCKGEPGLFGVYHPAPDAGPPLPGRNDIRRVAPQGNYGIAITWGDGHDTGIYSWEYLLEMEGG
jgi:DUF971 family protein